MRVNRDHAALFVRADAPWESVEELGAAIRDRPGELRASGTAFGGIWHVALAGWLIRNGLNADDLLWVSLNGSAPSLQELMAGGVDAVVCSVPEAQALIDAGEIRGLAVMAEERLPRAPDVPTLLEGGTDWTSFTWRGLALPLGVPPDRVEILGAAVRRVVTSEEYVRFLDRAGFGGAADGPEAFRKALLEEDEAYGEIFGNPAFASVRQQRYGPWLFPSVLAGLMVLPLLLATTARVRAAGRPSPAEGTPGAVVRALGAVCLVILYVLLVQPLGFLLTAGLLLFGFFLLLRVRLPVAAFSSVAVAAASYHVFGVLLRVPLPWGVFGW
jgi:hypothetical protein